MPRDPEQRSTSTERVGECGHALRAGAPKGAKWCKACRRARRAAHATRAAVPDEVTAAHASMVEAAEHYARVVSAPFADDPDEEEEALDAFDGAALRYGVAERDRQRKAGT